MRSFEDATKQLDGDNPDATAASNADRGHTASLVSLPMGGNVRFDPGEERVVFE